MEAITIVVRRTGEGYYYDIYDEEAVATIEDVDSLDGGLCTTSMVNALGMALEQAQALVRRENGGVCDMCEGAGWIHADEHDLGEERVERCDDCAKYANDPEAERAHASECGC